MKLVFVNIMQELQRFDSMSYLTQPPVPLAVLNAATPNPIETVLVDEQTDPIRFEGEAFDSPALAVVFGQSTDSDHPVLLMN